MPNFNRRQLLTAAGIGAVAIPATATGAFAAHTSPAAYPSNPVTTGAQRAASDGWRVLAGQKVGV